MAYSQDLREHVVRAIQRGDRTQAALATDFGVSLSFVEEVWRRQRETGNCAVKVWRHGRPARLNEREEQLRAEVAAHPDVTLAMLCERILATDGSRLSESAMSRTLKRLKITRKKRASTPVSRRRNA